MGGKKAARAKENSVRNCARMVVIVRMDCTPSSEIRPALDRPYGEKKHCGLRLVRIGKPHGEKRLAADRNFSRGMREDILKRPAFLSHMASIDNLSIDS